MYPTENPVAKHDLTCPKRAADESLSIHDAIGFQATAALFQALEAATPVSEQKVSSVYSYPDAPKPPLSRNLVVIGVAHVRLAVVRKLIGDDDDRERPSCLKKCTIAVKRADSHYRASLPPKDVQNSDGFANFCRRLQRENVVAILSKDKYGRFGILQPNVASSSSGRENNSSDFCARFYVGKADEAKSYLESRVINQPVRVSVPEQPQAPPWQPQTPPIDETADSLWKPPDTSSNLWQPPGSNTGDDDGRWQPANASGDGGTVLWEPPPDQANGIEWQPTSGPWNETDKGGKRKRSKSGEQEFHADSGAAAADKFYSGLTRTLDTRADSRIYHMRAFNGWVKATQIQELDPKARGSKRKIDGPLRILDLACGKGGDLGKWILHPRGISNYVGIDVARGSLRDAAIRARTPNMRQRLKRCTFTCADLGADVPGRLKSSKHTNMQKLLTWSLQSELSNASECPEFNLVRGGGISQDDTFDVVSIQFAIHYMMSTRKRARRFFQTVSELLEVGGNLIATTIDARVVLEHMMNLGLDLHFDDPDDPGEEALIRVGNGACQIRFPADNVKKIFHAGASDEDLFGLEYSFTLIEGSDHEKGVGDAVNLPEWLTPLPVLAGLANEAGLELEYAQNFHEFYALRSSPSTNAAAHSSLYNMKVLNRNGSIAADEWEISRLYVAVKFRKVRESSMTLDTDEESGDEEADEAEPPEIDPAAKAKLFPLALMKAKKLIGDDTWNTLSSDEKTRLTDEHLQRLASAP